MAKTWYSSVTVKAAIIGAFALIIVAGMHIWNNRSQIKQDNEKYKVEINTKNTRINDLQQQLSSREAEIQLLETQLTPFRTIALEKYTGSEQETLRKLANELEDLKKATNIPSLTLMRDRIRTIKNESGYATSLVFRPSNRLPIGSTAFIARITDNTDVRIKEFKKIGITEGVKKSIIRNGKEAIYNCNIQGYVFPEFKLVTTGPATIHIYGAHLSDQAVIFEVK
ncbi:MAG: hypothetical protein ACYST5_04435 [Planctomycetota bacterium]|jgi:hypothetical protein